MSDARRLGLSEEEIGDVRDALAQLNDTGKRAVWSMHRAALLLLDAAGTQWRTRLELRGGMLTTRYAGLDYAAARVSWDALELRVTPADWRRLRVLEAAAVAALNGEASHVA